MDQEGLERNKRQLSIAELQRLIFQSFKFSQGEPRVQAYLLRWSSYYYGKQNHDRVNEAYTKFGIGLKNKESDATIVTSRMHADQITEATIEMSRPEVRALFATHEQFTDAEFNRILQEIWEADDEWLNDKEGRPNRSEQFESNSLFDPFFSFGVHYIIRCNNANEESFDALLKHLRARLFITDDVQDVIDTYNAKHPDSPVSEEELFIAVHNDEN